MNWAEWILAVYAVIAAGLFILLLVDERRRTGRLSLAHAGDGLACSLLWPVILGIVFYERIGTWRRGDRP